MTRELLKEQLDLLKGKIKQIKAIYKAREDVIAELEKYETLFEKYNPHISSYEVKKVKNWSDLKSLLERNIPKELLEVKKLEEVPIWFKFTP